MITTSRNLTLFFAAICLLCFGIVVSQDRFLPFVLEIGRYFQVNSEPVRFSFSIYFTGAFIGNLFSVIFFHKYGAKNTLLGGLLLSAASVILFLIFPTFSMFSLTRGIEAFGYQLAATAQASLVATYFNGKNYIRISLKRKWYLTSGQIFSISSQVLCIGGIIVPAIAGYAGEFLGWISLFWMFLLVALSTFLLIKPSIPGNATAENQSKAWNLLFEGLKLASKDSSFLKNCFISFLITLMFIYQLTAYPYLFLKNLQLSPSHMGLVSLGIGSVALLGSGVCLKYAKRHEGLLRRNALILIICANGLLLLTNVKELSLLSFIIPLAVVSFAQEIIAPLQTAITLQSHSRDTNIGASFFNLFQMVACIVGSLLATTISVQDYHMVIIVPLFLSLLIGGSYLWINRKEV